MFSFFKKGQSTAEMRSKLAALHKSQAVIEFNMDGTIVTANENFLGAVGYSLSEIQGKHHSMFVEPGYRDSQDYRNFWASLNRGEFQAAEYKRLGKNGKEIWIQASYNPLLDLNGRPFKVVKFATDITDRKKNDNYINAQLQAIHKSQAVIEFNMDGTIVTANENFLGAVGYSLSEIQGKHHSMFVEPGYRDSQDYRNFWASLNRGEFQAAEYKRLGKNGKEIWIQASYNPLLDLNGRPFKVVKFATDVTNVAIMRIENEKGIEESSRVLGAMANGDLTQTLTYDYKGDFKAIKESINQTVGKLTSTIYGIKEAMSIINGGVHDLSEGSENLSSRTEQQASNLEETAASMEEISSTVKMTSDNVLEASQLGETSQKLAKDGGSIVNMTVEAMKEIKESSNKISEITNMIDEIAFQTNLLALNAAVEAARAGDAGKGFAVVAEEVRALAQRASAASKQIKSLIVSSGENVQKGVELSSKAGDSIGQIVDLSAKLAEIIRQIANASSEQTMGLDQVNTAISQLDQVTQENASMVQESAAAVGSLKDQSQKLNTLLGFFHLPGGNITTGYQKNAQESPVVSTSTGDQEKRVKTTEKSKTGSGKKATSTKTTKPSARTTPRTTTVSGGNDAFYGEF